MSSQDAILKTVKTCLIFEYQYTRDAWSCLSLDLFLKKSTVFRGTSLSLERELEVLSRELRTASSTTPTTLHTGVSVNRGNALFTVRRCSRHDMQVREVMKTAWAARLPVVAFRGFHGLNPSLPSARSLCFLVGLLPVLCAFCSNISGLLVSISSTIHGRGSEHRPWHEGINLFSCCAEGSDFTIRVRCPRTLQIPINRRSRDSGRS